MSISTQAPVTVANLEHLRGRAFVLAGLAFELGVKPSHLRFLLW
jgi:hypothetical protein